MQTQFKEQPYERCFSRELDKLTSHVPFSPDRCDEFFLGFDGAFWLPYDELFHIAHIRRSRRFRRSGIMLGVLNHLADDLTKRMPPFRFNLFVQYKRPDYLRDRRAVEWSHWNQAYYRFTTTPHQQKLLERVDAASQGRAVTVYASPAFWKNADLWKFAVNEEVVSNSGIVAAARLAGHGCYTYAKPGHQGIGFSEPESIEGPSLQAIVTSGVEQNGPIEAKEHILKAAEVFREAVGGDDDAASLLTAAERAIFYEPLDPDPGPSRLVRALITIMAFSDAFGISSYMFTAG